MIFIPYNTPSLKNSKVSGKFRPKTVSKYLVQLGIRDYDSRKKEVQEYTKGRKTYRPNLFRQAVGNYFDNREYPILIATHFVRQKRNRFDIINAQQIIFDLLTAHGFIEDDNADYIIPFSFQMNDKWYTHDKNNPGVYLKIIDRFNFIWNCKKTPYACIGDELAK